MKGRNLFKNSISALLPLAIASGVLFGVRKPIVKEVNASSYSNSAIPTTIDLNDASDSTIRNYYSNLNGKSASERQGTNLLKNLKPILKNNQKYHSYGSGATTDVWQAYEIVDRDWVKSPAEDIPGYNPSTKIITGYVYGSSVTNNQGTNPYIHALYINRNVDNQTTAWSNHNQNQWGINQEHIWPKSCGFQDQSKGSGARGDIMHLWAGNGRVNGTYHSNYYYGYVDKTKTYSDAGSDYANLSGNLRGFSKTVGGSYSVFEPQDSDKGDIARAVFYMAARYNYLSGSDSDGIDAGNPNLALTNELNWAGAESGSYTSSTSVIGQMGLVQDLLEWNRLDPPDEWEIHRNNLCYNNYTGNRNPFIDFPEWADMIWGADKTTKSADPTSDSINNKQVTPVSGETYTVSGGKFLDGDYVIASQSDGNAYRAMKASTSSDRFNYEEVTINNKKASINNSSIVWHIEKETNSDYYTIFNEAENKYAVSTGAKNKGGLSSTLDDKARWSLTVDNNADTYLFVNKYNSDNSVNADLRNNGTYGFACYASGNTYKHLTLLRKDNTSFVKVTNPSQITAGSTITFSATKNSNNYQLNNFDSQNKYYSSKQSSLVNDGLYYYSDEEPVTFNIEQSGTHYALHNSNGYLKNTSSSTLEFSNSIVASKCEFDFVMVNGNVALNTIGTTYYLRFNENSGTNPRFKFYGTSTSYSWCDIYIERTSGEAAAWADQFIKGTENCVITNWSSFSDSFSCLSFASKSQFIAATANPNGSLLEQAAARYDYIVGDPRYDVADFASERMVVSAKPNIIIFTTEDKKNGILIAIVCLLGLSSISGYLFIKRRKGEIC